LSEDPVDLGPPELAQRLFASLDPESDRDAEQAWLEETERRLEELESGKVAGIPAEQVLERARLMLRAGATPKNATEPSPSPAVPSRGMSLEAHRRHRS
jgi:putative addiction module component (TIGR02574 family)